MDLQQLLDALNHQTRKVNELRAENERLREAMLEAIECLTIFSSYHPATAVTLLQAALDAAGE